MAKTAWKRKSESALPTGKNKQRKTSASKQDGSDSELREGGSSDQLFVAEPVAAKYVKRTTVRARKSEPVKRATKADEEYEEDQGRMESQQFLALVEFESKKKRRAARAATEYMDTLEDSISHSEQSLNKRLYDLSTAATAQESDFTSAFQDAYAASRPLQPPKTAAGQVHDLSFGNLSGRTNSIITAAKAIITTFNSANEKASKIETLGLLDNNWAEQDADIAELIAIGHNIGLEKYDAMLMGRAEPVIEEESQAVYADLLFPPRGEVGGGGLEWGKVVRKQEKSARRLVKALDVVDAI